jgi:BTK motif
MFEKECSKMKIRISKLKSKRFASTQDYLSCKFCGKDFVDKENFNWSCRTHRSEFSGEMWWCCGKTSKDALGCKFNKHEARNEADDEDPDGVDKLK